MTIRRIAGATILALGLGAGTASAAPYLQPGMQTMIQQGGVEGTVLGDIFRPHVVYETVFVPVPAPAYGARSARRRMLGRDPRPHAHRGMRHFTAR